MGFEPTISAAERPQTYALDRAATGIGLFRLPIIKFVSSTSSCPSYGFHFLHDQFLFSVLLHALLKFVIPNMNTVCRFVLVILYSPNQFLIYCLFSWPYNPLWLYFHSPLAGFSFLVFEVS